MKIKDLQYNGEITQLSVGPAGPVCQRRFQLIVSESQHQVYSTRPSLARQQTEDNQGWQSPSHATC